MTDTELSSQAQPASPAQGRSFHLVDKELRPFLEAFPGIPIGTESLPALRQSPGAPPLPAPAPRPDHRIIPGPAGSPELKVIVLDPNPGATGRPALLHIHGGGYILGSAEGFVPQVQRYAMEADCVVVTVEYRLAPETPFPGSLEDNFAALQWLVDNSASLGIDPARIGVAGESAGGGHAAALTIAARDRGGPAIAFQLLVYPMLDDRTGSSRPASPYTGEYIWNAQHNRFGWTSLLGVPAGGDVPEGAVPARVEDLSGLPPAFIASGALDIFVEEDIAYAGRLIAAGVPVELYIEPGGFHGFNAMVPDAEVSQRFNQRVLNGLKRGLHRG
jgi:acetyl esterase/lipase